MSTYRITPTPRQQIFGLTGLPATGALINTYAAGTLTPIATYTDHSGTLAANPIVADSQGRWDCYLLAGTAYKFVVTDSTGSPLFTQDYVQVESATSSTSLTPNVVFKTANYAAVANDFVDCTSGSFTVTLPAASANVGVAIWVVNNGTGTITVGRTGSDTVGLATSQTLNPATASAQGDEMTFISDGVNNWNIT